MAAIGYTDGMLTSVGHGALDRLALTRLLREAGVGALVDIRRYPNSRHNPDIETTAIAAWTREAGLDYRWEQRLGGRRSLPAGIATEDPWWRVKQFAAYAAYTRTDEFADALGDPSSNRIDSTPRVVPHSPSGGARVRDDGLVVWDADSG